MEQLREVLISLNHIYVEGPDGMNVYFFQKYWHIVKHDLVGVIKYIFSPAK